MLCRCKNSQSPVESPINNDCPPVGGAIIKASARRQVCGRCEQSYAICGARVPAKFGEAAEHSIRRLPSVVPSTDLHPVETCSWRRDRYQAVGSDDSLTPPHDLNWMPVAKIDVGKPDVVALRMGSHPHNPPHYNTTCPHSPGTVLRLRNRYGRVGRVSGLIVARLQRTAGCPEGLEGGLGAVYVG
jgi:hypothetical protein